MKEVTIELSNIQSHEHTRLTLKPGINFIISPDNNVGKSTIFGVLNALIEVSTCGGSALDLNNLLRVNTDSGYAMFLFDDVQVVFWLLRKDKSNVTFLFQTTIDGHTAQSADPPQILLDALDIHGNLLTKSVHNILEADKVQLIVDEGKQCDEIIQSVLIDESVEKAKENISVIYSKAQQDKRLTTQRLGHIEDNLTSIQYNTTVDSFLKDLPILESLDEILDSDIPEKVDILEFPELPRMRAGLFVLTLLSDIRSTSTDSFVNIDEETLMCIKASVEVLQLLELIQCTPSGSSIDSRELLKLGGALEVYNNFSVVKKFLDTSRYISRELSKDEYSYKLLMEDLLFNNKIVVCPERGEVIYCGNECVPVSDRPTL